MKIYHLTDFDNISQFNLDYLDGGEHLNGPGVYFTSEHSNLNYDFYFNGYEGGTVYEVEVEENKLFSNNDIIDDEFINMFIENSIYKELFKEHEKEIKSHFENKDMSLFLQEFPFLPFKFKYELKLDIDLSNYNLKDFCLKFSELTGKNGVIIDLEKDRVDILILNPYDLKIMNSFQPLLKK